MSTKIFNGFRFSFQDLGHIQEAIMEWRADLRILHQQAANRFVAEIATNMIDDESIRPGSHSGEMPLMKAINLLWGRQSEIKKSQRRDPSVDFEFTLALMPFEGRIYGIVYTEQHEWLRLWMEKPFVEDFGYWDNTDAPEEVPDSEWQERARVWRAIFEPAIMSAPSMAGFAADCTHEALMPDSEHVADCAPSLIQRAARRAKFKVISDEVERLQSLAVDKDPTHLQSFAVEGMQWFQSDEGQAAFEAEKSRLMSILPPEITKAMLITTL